jgi:hypothetical protein
MGDYLRDLWRDIRGNAAWDAIRKGWDWIPLWWKSSMMTAVFAVGQWLSAAPWTVLVLLSVAVFGFSMLGLNQLDAWRDRRRGRHRPLPAGGIQSPAHRIEFYDSRSEKNDKRGTLEKELEHSRR